MQHPEKIKAKRIVLVSGSSPGKALDAYLALRTRINHERDACVESARIMYENRNGRRLQRRNAHDKMAKRAVQLRSDNETISLIGTILGRSQRTIYRLLRRDQDGERKS